MSRTNRMLNGASVNTKKKMQSPQAYYRDGNQDTHWYSLHANKKAMRRARDVGERGRLASEPTLSVAAASVGVSPNPSDSQRGFSDVPAKQC